MPRIPPKALNTVFYLYPTSEDARKDCNRAGTGFVAAIRAVIPQRVFTYFVTNWHVALCGAPVVRIDRLDGTPDIFDFDPTQWHFSPKYDIAVMPSILENEHKFAVLQEGIFLTKERKAEESIGPGDDVFMLGLFVDEQENSIRAPAVRFGHISVDPVPLLHPQMNVRFDSYCIDMHSRSGYSGSPVFVYRTPGYDLEEEVSYEGRRKFLLSGRDHLSLLGIHWGQFPEMWEVTSKWKLKNQNDSEKREPLLTDGTFIKGLSGMTCVLPAWTILEVLNMSKLKEERDEENARLKQTEEYRQYITAPVPEDR